MLRSSDASRQSSDDSSLPVHEVSWLERRVAPFAERFGNAPAVRALQEALPISFIGLLVALVALTVALAPRPWMLEASPWVTQLRADIPGAFAIMSIVLLLVLSVRLAQRLAYPVVAMTGVSAVAFIAALPPLALRSFGKFAAVLGTSGLFTAIVCCLATAGAIGLARRRFPGGAGVLLGASAIVLASLALNVSHVSLAGAIAALLEPLGTLGDTFTALFVIAGIEAVLWLFGIHGPALLAAVVLPVYLNLQFVNTEAYAHHLPLPHIVVVSTFMFVFPGGAGATLPLVLMLLRSRVPRLRKLAFATILPSLVNVNEPVIFGLPLVYNPILGIPFVVAPLVLVGTTYAAIAAGLVRAPIFYLPSTLPVFVNVYAVTLDWRAVALLAVNLVIAGAVWFPFVRIYERSEARRA